RRCWIAPRWIPPKEEAFGLSFLSIRTKGRSGELSHRDVLGSLLGLGIKREMVGDILILPERCFAIVAEEIAEYVLLHLTRIETNWFCRSGKRNSGPFRWLPCGSMPWCPVFSDCPGPRLPRRSAAESAGSTGRCRRTRPVCWRKAIPSL